MKCINKIISVLLTISLVFSLTGCGANTKDFCSYDLYNTSFKYGISNNGSSSPVDFYAKDLCVVGNDDIGVSQVDSRVASAGGAFNLDKQDVVYAQSIHEKMYPASTTKILTCYIACEYGNLDDYFTVSANAVDQESDSSVCDLKAGDVISLNDLLYGLMLRSGNDAAIAIAEGISSDVDSFVELMNKTASEIGATNSHFVTPNGLHDENHYTTVYDMYLILNKALENETFYKVFTSSKYVTKYMSGGVATTQEWVSTNKYLNNSVSTPSGFTVLGGKTGTTGAAGYCLVLYSENENHERIISIVFNADCRSNLYLLMNEILSNYCV